MQRPHPAESADVSRAVGFLTTGLAALAGGAALAAALSPLRHLQPGDLPSLQEFLQKHYKEMTPQDKEQVFARIRQQVRVAIRRAGQRRDPPPPRASSSCTD